MSLSEEQPDLPLDPAPAPLPQHYEVVTLTCPRCLTEFEHTLPAGTTSVACPACEAELTVPPPDDA